jgi:hypothetical protein
MTHRPLSEIRDDERGDDPVGCLPDQIYDAILQREEDGCESCGADVMVDFEDFDRTHRYTIKCLSRTPCASIGWGP